MDLQVALLIIDPRGVSIMSALFTNRRVTHLRDTDTIWNKQFLDEKIYKAQEFISLDTGVVSGEIAEIVSAYEIEYQQGVLCECLLINVIEKILNK